jgi:hypothetical protein
MDINRHNYEEFFLLYIDKELNAGERKAVEQFIQENPDLREELEMLKQSVFTPEKNLIFTNKQALLHPSSSLITELNYEEYFILYADEQLSPSEKTEVELFVDRNPHLMQDFQLHKQLKLAPEEINFPAKEGLYKRQGSKVVSLPWVRFAAAAMILLIAGSVWLEKTKPTNATAQTEPKKTNSETSHPKLVEARANIEDQQKEARSTTLDQLVKEPGIAPKNITERKKKADKNPTIKVEEKTEYLVNIDTPSRLEGKSVNTIVDTEKLKEHSPYQKLDAPVANTDLVINDSPLPATSVEEKPPVTFASNDNTKNVFIANIPVTNNSSLRGLFRKATRIIDKVNTLKNGNRSGVSIGNVEVAIQ